MGDLELWVSSELGPLWLTGLLYFLKHLAYIPGYKLYCKEERIPVISACIPVKI